jgi:hypothetical protein
MCGKHALNALIGSNWFSKADMLSSARDVQAAAFKAQRCKIQMRSFARGDGDYTLDVLLMALRQYVTLDNTQLPNAVPFDDDSELLSIMSKETDFLILEDENHWLVWRKDNRGLWWDLNSLAEPVYYTDVEAADELSSRRIQLFECTKLRKAVNRLSE